MGDGDLALRAERNMLRASELWTRAAQGATHEERGLVEHHAPAPMRSFNQLFVTDTPLSAGTLVAAGGRYRAADRPFRLRLRCELEPAAAEALAEARLGSRGGIPSLALGRAPAASRTSTSPMVGSPMVGRGPSPDRDRIEAGASTASDPSELEVRRVEDEASLADHVALVAGAFGWGAADLALVFTPALLRMPEWSGYVGYLDGTPVATAQLVVSDGVGGLYYVGTAETHRKRGFGERITRAAIAAGAEQGCDMFSLQASPLGRPVYERIGFRQVAEYHTYVPKEDAHE